MYYFKSKTIMNLAIMFLKFMMYLEKRYHNYRFQKRVKKLQLAINKMLQSNQTKEKRYLKKLEKSEQKGNSPTPQLPKYQAIRFKTKRTIIFKEDADIVLRRLGFTSTKFQGLVIHAYTYISKAYLKYELSPGLYLLFQLGRNSLYITEDKHEYYSVNRSLSDNEVRFVATFLLNDYKKGLFKKLKNTGYASIFYQPRDKELEVTCVNDHYRHTPDYSITQKYVDISNKRMKISYTIREFIEAYPDDKYLNKFGRYKLLTI